MTLTNLFSLTAGTPAHARLIYAGLLAGLLVPGLNVAAVLLAYLAEGKGDTVSQSHTLNQINIFWKSVAYVFVGLLLTYYLVGVLVIMATVIWYILRNARGLKELGANAPAENLESWLF